MTGLRAANRLADLAQRLGGPRSDERWFLTGDPNPDVLVAGYSHRVALLRAYEAGLTPLRVSVLSASDRMPGDIDASYWPVAAATEPSLPIIVAWTGNVAIMEFLFVAGRPFTIVTDREPATERSGPSIPAEAMKARLAATNSFADDLRKALDVLEAHPRLVIGTPPPKSEALIRSRLFEGTAAYQIMKDRRLDPDSATITPVEVRVAIWELLQELIRDIATEKGAQFVPVPDAVKAADGSLRDQLSAQDIGHGNVRYGALMWQAIGDALGHPSTA